MNIKVMRDILIGDPIYTVIGLAVSLVFLGVVYIRKAGNEFKKTILIEKNSKRYIVTNLLELMSLVEQSINKLSHQEKIVGMYNTRTVSWAHLHATKLKNISKHIEMLKSANLEQRVKNYITFQADLLNEIMKLEDQHYQKQKMYQEMIVFYDREFKKIGENYDEESRAKVKKQISDELYEYKGELEREIKRYNEIRDELRKRLYTAKSLNVMLQGELSEYKQQQVDSRKFYFRHLLYI